MAHNPTNHDFEQELLDFVRQPGYRPMKPRLIAKKLRVPADEIKSFNRLVKKLVKGNQLTYGANHLIVSAVPATDAAATHRSPAPNTPPDKAASAPNATASSS